MSTTYECPACSWQGKYSLTDAGHCPECGGETDTLHELYSEHQEAADGINATLDVSLSN